MSDPEQRISPSMLLLTSTDVISIISSYLDQQSHQNLFEAESTQNKEAIMTKPFQWTKLDVHNHHKASKYK